MPTISELCSKFGAFRRSKPFFRAAHINARFNQQEIGYLKANASQFLSPELAPLPKTVFPLASVPNSH
jgi:hypothetical protein